MTVYAQRHGAALPERAELEPGVTVEYIGPADGARTASPTCSRRFPRSAARCTSAGAPNRPDVVHALRWTSGLAALAAARDLRIPVVQSFDSLGVAERRHHVIAPRRRRRAHPP